MNLKDKKFLFVFRQKISQIEYTWQTKKKKHIDKDYAKEYRKQKPLDSGWMDAVENKVLIKKLSYPLDFLAYMLPYNLFIFVLKVSKKLKVFDIADRFILNIDILRRMFFSRCDVLYYYTKGIYKTTEWILIKNNKIVIEYEGRATSVSGRDLKKEIAPKGKILCSNMDWTNKIGKNRENFKVIKLGVSEEGLNDVDLTHKNLDVFIAGGIDDSVWSKRAEYFEYLLEHKKDMSVKLVGGYVEGDKYPLLQRLGIKKEYGDDFNNSLASAKTTIVIISDEHDKMSNGMPMRFYENALFEVLQLVYRTTAYKNTLLVDGIDFISFDSKEEMMKKLRYYLSYDEERNKIVKSAKKKVLENYTARECFVDLFTNLD